MTYLPLACQFLRIARKVNSGSRRPRTGSVCEEILPQIAAKALDAFAGIFEVGGLGGVGDTECRAQAERRALHHRDAFGFQQLRDEVLVVLDHLARRRSLA